MFETCLNCQRSENYKEEGFHFCWLLRNSGFRISLSHRYPRHEIESFRVAFGVPPILLFHFFASEPLEAKPWLRLSLEDCGGKEKLSKTKPCSQVHLEDFSSKPNQRFLQMGGTMVRPRDVLRQATSICEKMHSALAPSWLLGFEGSHVSEAKILKKTCSRKSKPQKIQSLSNTLRLS